MEGDENPRGSRGASRSLKEQDSGSCLLLEGRQARRMFSSCFCDPECHL